MVNLPYYWRIRKSGGEMLQEGPHARQAFQKRKNKGDG
jgi:hypothetical protein